jgi:hypothetical protein
METNLSPVETYRLGETHRLAKSMAWPIPWPGETYRLAKPVALRILKPDETDHLAKPIADETNRR